MALLLGIKAQLLHQTKLNERLAHAATTNNDDEIDTKDDCEIEDISLDGMAASIFDDMLSNPQTAAASDTTASPTVFDSTPLAPPEELFLCVFSAF